MPKIQVTSNHHLIVRSSLGGGNPAEELDRLFFLVTRQVGHLATVAKSYEVKQVCSFCGYPWDGNKTVNGCCEKDAAVPNEMRET